MNLPNSITVFRLGLIPVFVWQFLEDKLEIAALIFFTAWVSDVMDGYIARKFELVTNFGKIFDPFADKLMTLTALFLIAIKFSGDFPWLWAIMIILFVKEATLAIGGILLYKKIKEVVGANWMGKIATFLFTSAIILMMFDTTRNAATVIVWIALAAAFIALVTYVINFFKTVINKKTQVDSNH